MTLTRLPSGRRASQIGLDSSTRRPTWLTMRWQIFISCALSAKRTVAGSTLPLHFDIGRVGAVDHDVGDVVAGEQRLERPVAENVVADVLEQLLLLGDRHHHVLDGDDLADDVANFLARRFRIELGELGQVDGVDQRVEDRGLDVVVLLGARALDGLALRFGGRLADAGGSDFGRWVPERAAAARAETCGGGAGT